MEKNSPPAASSLEKQIDSFLEHFKRSASKAMEAEWCSIGGVGSSGGNGSGNSNSNSNTGNSVITTTSSLTTHNSTATAITTTQANENVSSAPPVWPTARKMSFEKHQHLLQRTRSRSSVLDMNSSMMMAKSTEELDAELESTLREIDPHNYEYLLERCKRCNVNARHLLFLKKDQIHELIPKSELGILAEFEYLLNQWQISKGYTSLNTKTQLNRDSESNNLIIAKEKPHAPHVPSNNQPVVVVKQALDIKPIPLNLQGPQISSPAMVADEPDELLTVLDSDENSQLSNAKRMKFDDDEDEEQFTLEIIIPELLKELKGSYESKNSLLANERRFLCTSIVDYFISRNIKFSTNIMDKLAEQIVEHFPKEDKKSWFYRNGRKRTGRLYCRFHNSRRNIPKQTNNTSTSKILTNSASNEDENSKASTAKHMKFDDDDEEKFTLEIIIPELLKELKESYESNNTLSTNERRLLCSAIVDYFETRNIKFSSDTMDDLAEQIVEHFPKEDKKSWCNRDGYRTCGRFYFRLINVRRNTLKQTNDTSISKVVTNSASSEGEEKFTLETIIPELLKELKESYESKNSLSINERRLLCSAIVNYFVSRNIKFNTDIMDELAEQIVKHFPTEDKKSWCNRDGHRTSGRFFFRFHYVRRDIPKQTKNAPTSKVTLEIIIPELLKELKGSYKSKNSLSTNERRVLCSSIVDYFESRELKLGCDTMNEVAEQIVEHFPTEDKKSWFNGSGSFPRGQLFYRSRYVMSARYKMPKQTNDETSNLKVVINSTSSEPESSEEFYDEDSKSIQAWLKYHKCENFSEIIDLWEDTMKYRCWQTQNLKDLKSIQEFLNNWPSYKLEAGHELLTMDFRYLYPQSVETFRIRWLVYKENIEQFLKVELKDVNCINLLEKYQLQKATINEDSSSCILIYLIHAITKPLRHFEAVSENENYAISNSQHSMMRLIRNKVEIDEYTEPYPCIFVVGDSMLEVEECYVVFMDLHYKLSYENCLAVCVQIFTVLNMEDPPASQCFWEFIRGYLFNIAKDKEKFNLATKNMVNYLETIASCI